MYFERSKLTFIIKFLELHNGSRDPRIERYREILTKIDKKLGLANESKEDKGAKGKG
jgi:hypothetical protein